MLFYYFIEDISHGALEQYTLPLFMTLSQFRWF